MHWCAVTVELGAKSDDNVGVLCMEPRIGLPPPGLRKPGKYDGVSVRRDARVKKTLNVIDSPRQGERGSFLDDRP